METSNSHLIGGARERGQEDVEMDLGGFSVGHPIMQTYRGAARPSQENTNRATSAATERSSGNAILDMSPGLAAVVKARVEDEEGMLERFRDLLNEKKLKIREQQTTINDISREKREVEGKLKGMEEKLKEKDDNIKELEIKMKKRGYTMEKLKEAALYNKVSVVTRLDRLDAALKHTATMASSAKDDATGLKEELEDTKKKWEQGMEWEKREKEDTWECWEDDIEEQLSELKQELREEMKDMIDQAMEANRDREIF